MRCVAKQWGRQAAAWGYCVSGDYSRFLRGKLSILMYHRVLPAGHPDLAWVQPGMYVYQESFERQLRLLKREFEVVSFADLLALWSEGRWDERARYCTVTFDDGWLDNVQYAWPLLRHYAVPATIFLPTSWIGSNQWFWPDRMGFLLCRSYSAKGDLKWREVCALLRRAGLGGETVSSSAKEFAEHVIMALKDRSLTEVQAVIEAIQEATEIVVPSERVLINWTEAREMSCGGVAFGSHARTHTLLPQLTAEECAGELRESARTLAEQGLNTVKVFCYPNGSYNETIVQQVVQAGYQAAVTTKFGYEGASPDNRHLLHRIGIHEDVSADDARFVWQLARPDRRVAHWAKRLCS